MVEPTDLRNCDDIADRLNGAWHRGILFEGKVQA